MSVGTNAEGISETNTQRRSEARLRGCVELTPKASAELIPQLPQKMPSNEGLFYCPLSSNAFRAGISRMTACKKRIEGRFQKKALNPNRVQEMPFRLKIPVKPDVNCISFTHHKGPLCLFHEMPLPIAIGIGLLTLITNFSCTIRVYVSLVSPRCFSCNVTMLTFHATQHTAVTKPIDL